MPLEVVAEWTGPPGTGFLTTHYFQGDTLPDATVARANMGTWLTDADASITDDWSWRVLPEVKLLNTATGELTAVLVDATPHTGRGGNTSQPVADATMALIRWGTGQVVNGRRLQGRTFLPGFGVDGLTNGNLDPLISEYQTDAAQAYVDGTTVTFGIWHRPVNGAGGEFHQAQSGTCWEELAVQRRRRG